MGYICVMPLPHYKKNVFPLFIDDKEPVQVIDSAGTDKEWNKRTSRVLIQPSPVGAVKIKLGKPETPGIMVEVGKDNGDFSCIVVLGDSTDPYGPFNNDAYMLLERRELGADWIDCNIVSYGKRTRIPRVQS